MTDTLFELPTPPTPAPTRKPKRSKPLHTATPVYGLTSNPAFSPVTIPKEQTFATAGLPTHGVEITGRAQTARHAANEAARALLAQHSGALTDDDRDTLRAYSGGGNLGESTDAYYTPTRLAALVWFLAQGLDRTARRVLEPACGTGIFFASAPSGVRLTGTEYDPDAAEIARRLYPHATIHTGSFETYHGTSPDVRAQLVIGNPPFGTRGDTRQTDLRHQDLRRAEQYFIRAGLDRLEPGGLLMYILPHSFMGDRHAAFRREVTRRATVLATPLIPTGAFTDTGANLNTMLLIVQKHDHGVPEALATLPAHLQERFLSSRAQAFIAGTSAVDDQRPVWPHLCPTPVRTRHGQYGQLLVEGQPVLTLERAKTILDDAKRHQGHAVTCAHLEGFLLSLTRRDLTPNDSSTDQGSADQDHDDPALNQPANIQRDVALTALRGADRHAIPERTVSPCRQYVFKRGQWRHATLLTTPEAQVVMRLARALQQQTLGVQTNPQALWDELTGHAGGNPDAQRARIEAIARTYPTANLVLHPPARVTPRTVTILPGALPDVATQLALAHLLTRETLAREAMITEPEAAAFLRAHYRFDGQRWVTPTEYDFGHAYHKAEHARAQATRWAQGTPEHQALTQQADEFERRALAQARTITETPLTPRDPLLPVEVVQDWVNTYLGTRDGGDILLVLRERGLLRLVMRLGPPGDRYRVDQIITERLEQYLNYNTYTDRIEREGRSIDDQEAQRAAALKKATRYERSIERHFRDWLTNSVHASAVEDHYNRTRNAYLTAPEDTTALPIAAWRGPTHHLFQRGDIRTLAAWGHGILMYEVGLGKTFTALGLLSILKGRGEARRPWIVTPLSLTGNWVMNAHTARPDWRVVVIGMNSTGTFDEDGLPEYEPDSTRERKQKLATLLHEPPDLVIISLEAFKDVPLLEETRLNLITSDAALLAQGAEAESFSSTSSTFRGRKVLVKEEEFLDHLLSRSRAATDTDLPFELFAPDTLIFEEAHKLKNLFEAPDYLGEKPRFMGAGLASARAYDAYLKARWVRQQQQGRGTYSLTATAYKNSPLEVGFALALTTDDLHDFGLHNPAAFMMQYCLVEPTVLTNPDGSVSTRPAVTGFKNLRELRTLMRAHIIERDVQTCRLDHRIGLPLPPLETHLHTIDLTPEQEAAYGPERQHAKSPAEKGEHHLFAIHARMLALNLRPELTCGGRNPRAELAAQLALDAETTGYKSIAFLDLAGDGGPGSTIDLYRQAYIRAGIPERSIEVITAHTHPDAPSRLAAERRFRRGDTRHIIASSVAREGLNLQYGTKHHIHLDLPHDPQDLKQRNGRGYRQGNPCPNIQAHLILARGSIDALRYQNLMGKRGWLDHLRSGTNHASNPAAFQAADTALLLAHDPDAVKQYLAEQAAKLAEDTARQEHHAAWEAVHALLTTLTLLRARHAAAHGRKNGATAHDLSGLSRLKTELDTHARAVGALAEPLRAALHSSAPITWSDHLPLTPGGTFTLRGETHTIKLVGQTLVTSGGSLDYDALQDATSFTLPDTPHLDPFHGLPGDLTQDAQVLLTTPPDEATPDAPVDAGPSESITPDSALADVPLYAGHRRIRVTHQATLPNPMMPTPQGLIPAPNLTPPPGAMYLAVSPNTLELIAEPDTATALRDALTRNPLPILQRLTPLLDAS